MTYKKLNKLGFRVGDYYLALFDVVENTEW